MGECAAAVGCGREPGRGNVEEAVEIDAHRRVEDPAQQKRIVIRRLVPLQPAQPLVDSVGEGEGVQSRVPIAEFVAGVEAGDAQGRGVGDHGGQFHFAGAGPQRGQQRVNDGARIIVQQDRNQVVASGPAAAVRLTCGKGGRDLGARISQQFDQIDGIAPGVGLLHPPGRGIARHKAGQDRLGLLPTDDIQRFEGFVGKNRADVPRRCSGNR